MRMQWLQNMSVDGPKSARHEHNCVRNATSASDASGTDPLTQYSHTGCLLARRGLHTPAPGRACIRAAVHTVHARTNRRAALQRMAPSGDGPDLPSRPPRGRPCWRTAGAGRHKAMRHDDDASGRGRRRGHYPSVKATGAPSPAYYVRRPGQGSDGTRHPSPAVAVASGDTRRARRCERGYQAMSKPKHHPCARARTALMHVRRMCRRPRHWAAPRDTERDPTAVRMARHSSCSPL